MRIARLSMFGMALLGLVTFGAQAGLAAEMGMGVELKTAITHAGFAAKYDTIKEVTLHLHHVLNCLVGPNDKMFDAGAGNPCQGQGNGILADIKAQTGEDQQYQVAWWLAQVANEAIKMGNLNQARAAAHILEVQLSSMAKM
jgi:hypothetical protein